MRKPLSDVEQLKKEEIAERKIRKMKSFKRSHHYRLIMSLFEREFSKNKLENKITGLSALEQIGIVAAVQTEAKQRFDNVKKAIEAA